jgi:hypothetical protein
VPSRLAASQGNRRARGAAEGASCKGLPGKGFVSTAGGGARDASRRTRNALLTRAADCADAWRGAGPGLERRDYREVGREVGRAGMMATSGIG